MSSRIEPTKQVASADVAALPGIGGKRNAHPVSREQEGISRPPQASLGVLRHRDGEIKGSKPAPQVVTKRKNQSEIEEPLLTSEQLYARDLQQVKFLTPEESQELAQHARLGDSEAKKALIEDCLGYIQKVATTYALTYSRWTPHTEYMELVSIGNYTVVEKFDKALQVDNTSGYLRGCVKEALKKYCFYRSSLIPVTAHTDYFNDKIPIERLDSLEVANVPVANKEIEEEQSEIYKQYGKVLPDLVQKLPKKQRDIIIRSFGLNGKPEESLSDITFQEAGNRTASLVYSRRRDALRNLRKFVDETQTEDQSFSNEDR